MQGGEGQGELVPPLVDVGEGAGDVDEFEVIGSAGGGERSWARRMRVSASWRLPWLG